MGPIVSSSPHLKSDLNTRRIMLEVIGALLPAAIAAVVFFKMRAVWIIANCVVVSVITEAVVCKVRGKPLSINDGSAALTGLLLALILPPGVSWYAASLGAVFAILVAKHLFGGLGSNIFNPALMGRAFLMVAYPKMLTTFIEPFSVDVVSKATPLALRKFSQAIVPIKALFLGNVSGSLGETSAICLIIGGLYLLARRIADWRIPISLLLTTALVSGVLHLIEPANGSIQFHLLSGGLLLGAFFMATDPVTTPVTKKGRAIFGISCGILIMIIRYWGGYPEGVMYSILFFNAFTPLINRYTKARRFGT